MIKTQLLVPETYYKESRDFQLFGRIYDLLFNYLKTEIDLIRSFPLKNNQNTYFLELLLRTLNFRSDRDYQLNQLQALAKSWMNIIRNKGSKYGIDLLIRCILRAENINNKYEIEIDSTTNNYTTITIKIRDLISSQEFSLLEECLNYILPIGTLFVIQDIGILDSSKPMNIKIEEHTSVNNVSRTQLGSLATTSSTYINKSKIAEANTGNFSQEVTDNLIQGTLKVGALASKKEEGN